MSKQIFRKQNSHSTDRPFPVPTSRTMWITLCLFTLFFLARLEALDCNAVPHCCSQANGSWTKCYEREITTCNQRLRHSNFHHLRVNVSQEAERSVTNCRVNVPSSALQMSRGNMSDDEVLLVVTVLNSNFFQPAPAPGGGKGRSAGRSHHRSGTVLGDSVVVVKAGSRRVRDLLHPVRLTFRRDKEIEEAACVFWQETYLDDRTGYWSTEGCHTNVTQAEIVCCCDHLSFFAVVVNPVLSVEKASAPALRYISFTGSALSVLFTILALIIYARIQQRRPDKTVCVHLHLTGALLCLHLSFLLSSCWVLVLDVADEDWICKGLGLLLHCSLMATFLWMAVEGFHLYLLLVRVFNIYIKRYMLKLSLVAWGLPTLTAALCVSFNVYGKHTIQLKGDDNYNSTVQLCWISSQFPQGLLISYITTAALPFLVVLFNFCMVCLVVFKMCGLRKRTRGGGSSSGWKKMNDDNWARLWRDGSTLLGLSCVLGLPWGLSGLTYVSLLGIYLFTVLNSLQGIFIFLWSLALTCKSRAEKNSSLRNTSSQKLMTISSNN
ncbi:adhesion G-protein coupled receptor G5-like [Takifugu rubripes]|uniref:adhesion G-protein coupled receptor G5-like n=1 Tax=Takifugu rubripes TaxID=31033 RepID=UPI001145FDE9|nr:adhesion G-protein coupled receptor G5-like [Takifugu rubripes]